MAGSGLDTALLGTAVRDGAPDVIDLARDVGASAAGLGVPLVEVLDQIEKVYAPRSPDFAAVRAAAAAWSELALLDRADTPCENPLTSLASVSHLRSRLAEIYRLAQHLGQQAGDVSALVVVEFPRWTPSHDIELALRALDLADVLRLVFTRDETFVQLTPRRFTVLAHSGEANDLAMRLLTLLVERMLSRHGPARLWIEHLPASEDAVAQMLASLGE